MQQSQSSEVPEGVASILSGFSRCLLLVTHHITSSTTGIVVVQERDKGSGTLDVAVFARLSERSKCINSANSPYALRQRQSAGGKKMKTAVL